MKKKSLALACLAIVMVGCGHPHSTRAPTPEKPMSTPAGKPSAEAAAADAALEVVIGMVVEAITNATHGEYNDAALSAYVTDIGLKIAKQSERPDLPWHFQVLDTEDIGAHALPGGRVTITRGLLAFLGSEAEVAAVLAHEVAHVAFRHSHSKWSPSVAVAEIGETADVREQLRDADHERQADSVGTRYLSNAGYDPRAMVDALSAVERGAAFMRQKQERQREKLKREPSSREEDDSFDPHPAPPARLARAAVAAGGGGGDLGRERYLSRIKGLEWGEGSATPFLLGERYIVPGDFSFAVPRGYQATSEGGVLQARVSPKDESLALVALRLPRSFMSEAVRASISKKRHVAREIMGRPALVARFTPPTKSKPISSTSTSTSTKHDEDTLMAVVEGPTNVLVVAIKGNSPAAERVLDGFLASAGRDTREQRRRSVLAMERVEAKGRFEDFVRSRCSETSLELATALNNNRDGVIEAGTLVKCVGNASR